MTRRRVQIDLSHLSFERDRHSRGVKRRWYVRRFGRRIRIREKPGTPEFLRAYDAAIAELEARRPRPTSAKLSAPHPVNSFGWLAAKYFGSPEFRALDAQSQRTRRRVIESCLVEPFKGEVMGDCPIVKLTTAKIRTLRDAKAGKPGAANNRRKYLSAMFAWALEQTPPLVAGNPVRDVARVQYATDGFHTWLIEEVEQFRGHHAVGTKPRLALEMLLFIGCRRGDLVALGRQHRRGNELQFVPRKTRYRRKTASVKPIIPELAEVIQRSPCGDLTYLVTAYGKAFSAKGFGNWFREQCDAAGLPQCTAHGLRKAGATLAAENGATVHMLMAMYDWASPAQAKPYTDAADRKRLAAAGMPLLAQALERKR